MFRNGLSLFIVTVAAGLPFAVQARLETSPNPRAQVGRANAVLAVAPSEKTPKIHFEQSHRVQRAPDGMFYVTARINGQPIRFLVDTGASIVILSSDDARAAGIAKDAIVYADSVDTVAGKARVARTSIEELEIAGRRVDGLEAAVVENGVGVSLLGHNALARFDALSIEGDELILH